jgi:hypothetical protein
MNPVRERLVRELFDRACEFTGSARIEFPDRECAGDAGLRDEIESLLEHDASEHDVFADAPVATFARRFVALDSGWTPERIEGYRVVRRCGSQWSVVLRIDVVRGREGHRCLVLAEATGRSVGGKRW